MKLISTKDSSSSGQVLYIVRQLDSNSQNQYFHIKMQHVYSNLILYLKTYSLESDEVSKFIELVQSHKVHTQTKNVLHNMQNGLVNSNFWFWKKIYIGLGLSSQYRNLVSVSDYIIIQRLICRCNYYQMQLMLK